MKEHRTERVSPGTENDVIEILAQFGWELVNSQEIYNEHTEVDGVEVTTYGNDFFGGIMKGATGSDGKISVKQRQVVTHFVALQFERDTSIPHYKKLKELGDDYERCLSCREPKKPIKRTVVLAIGVVILLISIVLAIIEGNSPEVWELIAIGVFGGVMLPFTAVGWVLYKKRSVSYISFLQLMQEIWDKSLELNCNE